MAEKDEDHFSLSISGVGSDLPLFFARVTDSRDDESTSFPPSTIDMKYRSFLIYALDFVIFNWALKREGTDAHVFCGGKNRQYLQDRSRNGLDRGQGWVVTARSNLFCRACAGKIVN